MDSEERIAAFLAGKAYAVAGASRQREKYGNKVLRVYMQQGLTVYPLNPSPGPVEGLESYAAPAALPAGVHGLSVVTPPAVSELVVEEAAASGIGHIWMQPGAESPEAVRRGEELGLNVIAGGPCILVVLGYSETAPLG